MTARVRVPKVAKKGEVVEIRCLLEHPSESGLRKDENGKLYPRNIVASFVCTYGGVEVIRGDLQRGISRNPYFSFWLRAEASGEIAFRWQDESGAVFEEKARMEVV